MVLGVSPARWAGLRNGRAVGARSRHLAAAGDTVKQEFLPSSAREAGIGLLDSNIRFSDLNRALRTAPSSPSFLLRSRSPPGLFRHIVEKFVELFFGECLGGRALGTFPRGHGRQFR